MLRKFCTVASLFSLCSALHLAQEPAGSPQEGKVVFLRETEIWTAKGDGSELRRLTNDGIQKSGPVWSPDGKKIAYHFTSEDGGIAVVDAQGEKLKCFRVSCASVQSMEWIAATRIGIDCHINPSLGEYLVVDLDSGKILDRYLGYSFRWSPDKTKVAHVGWVPHFAEPEQESEYLQINGRSVYIPQKHKDVHSFPIGFHWSPDSKHVAFIDKEEKSGNEQLLIISEGRREIRWDLPKDMIGIKQIDWLDDQTLVLCKEDQFWSFNRGTRQITRLEEEAKKIRLSLLQQEDQRKRLMQTLKGFWPNWWFEK